MTISADRLRDILSYESETGLFHWRRAWGRRRMGVPAGCFDKRGGYIVIGIDRVVYQAHRLAWLYVHGEMPDGLIDHRNGDGTDNRLSNLRSCSQAQNLQNRGRQKNNTSGFKGVVFHPQSGKWRARIKSNGKHYSLGLYGTKEEAHAAYLAGATRLHGDFAHT